mmetsp:Transcript_19777/g.29451  ORF Transcript_19777/g.29451 Transcript_19777/m.29451 type:complete len:168 (-) Transcript_19777:106-609(-)
MPQYSHPPRVPHLQEYKEYQDDEARKFFPLLLQTEPVWGFARHKSANSSKVVTCSPPSKAPLPVKFEEFIPPPPPSTTMYQYPTAPAVPTQYQVSGSPPAQQQRPPEKKGLSKYKTKFCWHWQEKRSCPFGEGCTFAHSEQELKAHVLAKGQGLPPPSNVEFSPDFV